VSAIVYGSNRLSKVEFRLRGDARDRSFLLSDSILANDRPSVLSSSVLRPPESIGGGKQVECHCSSLFDSMK
jgi:hypothetical protein